MAKPRREWLESITQILAASCGIDLSGGARDVLPYNPVVMKALFPARKDGD